MTTIAQDSFLKRWYDAYIPINTMRRYYFRQFCTGAKYVGITAACVAVPTITYLALKKIGHYTDQLIGDEKAHEQHVKMHADKADLLIEPLMGGVTVIAGGLACACTCAAIGGVVALVSSCREGITAEQERIRTAKEAEEGHRSA